MLPTTRQQDQTGLERKQLALQPCAIIERLCLRIADTRQTLQLQDADCKRLMQHVWLGADVL